MSRLGRHYEVGDRIWENGVRRDEKWSAGRVVAIVEAGNRLYMLLRANNDTETIYTCLKDCVCKPSLPRFMPYGVISELARLGEEHELDSDDVDESSELSKKNKMPKPKVYTPDKDESLSDIDDKEIDNETDNKIILDINEEEEMILPVISLTKIPS